MIYLVFICLVYFFISAKPADKLGLKRRLLFYKYIEIIEQRKKQETIFQKGVLRFRRVARRYIALSRTFKKDIMNRWRVLFKIPMFRLYFICILFWIYTMYLVYYRMIDNGFYNKKLGKGFIMYKCFYFNSECFDYESFWRNKLVFATLLCWIIAMVYQLKFGLPLWRSLITEFTLAERLLFMCFDNLPFIKEISVLTKFASTRTSLLMWDWLSISDVYFQMKKAKFFQKSIEAMPFVPKSSKFLKGLLSIGVLVVTIAFFIGPMIPYSDIFENGGIYDIKGAQIKIDIVSNKAQILGTLFKSDLVLSSQQRGIILIKLFRSQ